MTLERTFANPVLTDAEREVVGRNLAQCQREVKSLAAAFPPRFAASLLRRKQRRDWVGGGGVRIPKHVASGRGDLRSSQR